jgi:anti-sigma regulatory factor (Ser/Thr protein kinase)
MSSIEGPDEVDMTEVEAAEALPPGYESAGRARSFVRGAVRSALCDDAVDTVELLTSEVVTNAIRHAAAAPKISVRAAEGRVRVSVEDADARWPTRRNATVDDLSGRGIALVDSLAAGWGVERLAHSGKSVWFEVRGEPRRGPLAAVAYTAT